MKSLPEWLNTPSQAVPALEVPAVASLLLDISVEPGYVSVGETVEITLTVVNQGTAAASSLETTLSFPDAKVSVDAPNMDLVEGSWHARHPDLANGKSATLAASVTILDAPPGGALLAHVAATAAGLVAVEDVAGAIIVAAEEAATETISTGTRT